MSGKQNSTPEHCPLESVLGNVTVFICEQFTPCPVCSQQTHLSSSLWQLISTVRDCTPGFCKRRGMQFLQEGQVKVEQLIPSSGGKRGQGSWLLLWRYFNAYLHHKPFLVYPDIFCKKISKEEKEPIPHILNFVSFLILCWDLNCINLGSSDGISGLIRKQTMQSFEDCCAESDIPTSVQIHGKASEMFV